MTDTTSRESDEAVDFVRQVAEADTNNRQEALEDLRFRYGEQWPAQNTQSRVLEERPAMTINETDAYLRQIVNAIKQRRPRLKIHAAGGGASKKIAEVIAGLCRHVEVQSSADVAYNNAADFAATMGWGYFRIRTDWVREDSFDQDIFIDPVWNPFAVYFDPDSTRLDGADAERVVIVDDMPKAEFERLYPGADMANFTAQATGDRMVDWMTKDTVRVAEFFKVDKVKAELVALTNGRQITTCYGDEIPPPAKLEQWGLRVKGTRPSYKRIVRWQKQTAMEVIEKRDFPGRYIPVIPVYGVRVVIDGKLKKFGAVRFGRDPQLLVNFWTTAVTETAAQAPKAKWLATAGAVDGYEAEYAKANVSAKPLLHWNHIVDGVEQPQPSRIAPEGPSEAQMANLGLANAALQRVMGVFDPEVGKPQGQNKSGRAIQREQGQSQQSNYHFYDNLTESIKHGGRLILDLQRKVYDTQREMRIIGADGRPSVVMINERAVDQVRNDIMVGNYEVDIDIGPAYNTKREEAIDVFGNMMGTPLGEKIAQVADDIVVRMIDVEGSDAIADRLAAANPLAQMEGMDDLPPQAQAAITSLQARLKQAMGALQQAGIEIKFGLQKEQVRQDGETKRELMRVTGKAHDTETRATAELRREMIEDVAWRHDVVTKALSAMTVAEIKAFADLAKTRLDNAHDAEQVARAAAAGKAEAIASESHPLT